MMREDNYETVQEALNIAIKEVSERTDGSKDIYRFRKANPKIYKYLVIGIYIENTGMDIEHLKQLVETYDCIKGK